MNPNPARIKKDTFGWTKNQSKTHVQTDRKVDSLRVPCIANFYCSCIELCCKESCLYLMVEIYPTGYNPFQDIFGTERCLTRNCLTADSLPVSIVWFSRSPEAERLFMFGVRVP